MMHGCDAVQFDLIDISFSIYYSPSSPCKNCTKLLLMQTEHPAAAAHLKLFDSPCPRTALIRTDSCQSLHFSPSCIVWKRLDGKAEVVVTGLCLRLHSEGLCYLQATLHQFTEDQDTWSSLFSPGSNFSNTYGHCRDTGL